MTRHKRQNALSTAITFIVGALTASLIATSVMRELHENEAKHYITISNNGTASVETADGMTPVVEGIAGPAIMVEVPPLDAEGNFVHACGGENCTTVPISYTQTNLTEDPILVDVTGGWLWTNDATGESRFVAQGGAQFSIPPGSQAVSIPANIPNGVLQDIIEFANDGVFETAWSVTGALDPFEDSDGDSVTITSVRFTLIHPDSQYYTEPGLIPAAG